MMPAMRRGTIVGWPSLSAACWRPSRCGRSSRLARHAQSASRYLFEDEKAFVARRSGARV
eukprot:3413326-Rhodomonas_salina.1